MLSEHLPEFAIVRMPGLRPNVHDAAKVGKLRTTMDDWRKVKCEFGVTVGSS